MPFAFERPTQLVSEDKACDTSGEATAEFRDKVIRNPAMEDKGMEKPWHLELSLPPFPYQRRKETDTGSSLMAGVGVVLGGLAIGALLLAPFPNSSAISSSSLSTPLIPGFLGFPGPQSLFLPPPKLENHEKCGLVGGGKVGNFHNFNLKSC